MWLLVAAKWLSLCTDYFGFEKFQNTAKKDILHFRGDTAPSFATKATIGLTAGAAGSFVGTPAEVALIRMCADGK